VLLNDGTPTRLPERAEHKPSAIDLTMITPGLEHCTVWHVESDDLGSDHLPISITIGNEANIMEEPEKDSDSGYDFQKADWHLFQEQLGNVVFPQADNSLQEQYDRFHESVIAVANKTIPRKQPVRSGGKKHPWWNKECATAVKEKSKAYNAYRKRSNEETHSNYRTARSKCKVTISKCKEHYWANYMHDNITDYKDTSKLWKKIKQIKQQTRAAEQPLLVNGKKTANSQEKAEVLATTFAKASQSNSLPESLQTYRDSCNKLFTDPLPNNATSINQLFTLSEIKTAIFQIKKVKKATGTDPISYQMFRQFPVNILQELLCIYNRCYVEGIVPYQWKQAIVVPLLKSGKPRSNPNSYRPISLTPHLGKLYERLVKRRLEFYLEKNNIVPTIQSGFKRGRGCTDNLVKLTSQVKHGIARGQPTLTCMFDIKRAYDSVWLAKLMQKLADVGVSGHMYESIRALLYDRSMQVKVGGARSTTQKLDMGVAQGSIIAPICFSVMLHDIVRLPLKHVNMTLYADDIVLWGMTKQYKKLSTVYACQRTRSLFQANVTLIVDYMKENGFQFSAEKTSFVVFNAGRRKILKDELYVVVQGTKVFPVKNTKYLGVIVDESFTWHDHISSIIDKTSQVWNLLKILKHTPGCNNVKSLLHVIRALVRSRLCYGQEAYFAAAASHLDRLEARECSFLRSVLGLARHTPREAVYRAAGWIPLGLERKLRCAQYQIRSRTIDNITENELSAEFGTDEITRARLSKRPTVAAKTLSFGQYTKDIIEDYRVDAASVTKVPHSISPPWLLPHPTCRYNYTSVSKSDDPLYVSSVAKELLATEYSQHLHIYTDGSKLESGEVGCAFYIPAIDVTKMYRVNDNVSTMSAELVAITMALTYIIDCPRHLLQAVIISDSKSSLQALENPQQNRHDLLLECLHMLSQLRSRGTEVEFVWVPSHTEVRGNEVADRAAKHATKLPDITYNIGHTKSEICAILRQGILSKWKNVFKEKAELKSWPACNSVAYVAPDSCTTTELELYHRLKSGYIKHHVAPAECVCGEELTLHHIFNCMHILPEQGQTRYLMRQFHIQCHPTALLLPHLQAGWRVTRCLLKDLLRSEVGQLL
jgi:ribonuclease HI